MRRSLIMVLALGGLLAASLAEARVRRVVAPKPAPASGVLAPPKVQRMIFGEGDEVQAGRETGAGDVIDGMRRAKRSRLMVVRQSFVPELIKSAEDLW